MNVEERAFARAVKSLDKRLGPKAVARKVGKMFGRKPPSPAAVSRLFNGKTYTGAPSRRRGRPRKTTKEEDERLPAVALKAVRDSKMLVEVPARVITAKWKTAKKADLK